ncbi:MAG: glycosyltransferase family 4 protein [Marinoscillum sp.]
MKKILVVGQTPPPYHGQAISTERMLNGKYKDVKLYHVRLAFSSSHGEIGKFKLKKLLMLPLLIIRIGIMRIWYNIPTLYYMPGGIGVIPIYKDLLVLLPTRFLFKNTIFHFRSAGIEEHYKLLGPVLKRLFHVAFDKPDIAIRLSKLNPDDSSFLNAKIDFILPNGMEDVFSKRIRSEKSDQIVRILYIGSMISSKGIFDILKALSTIDDSCTDQFHMNFVGKFHEGDEEERFHELVESYQLSDSVSYLGEQTGEKKWDLFNSTDIFCFPSYYENESFGNVLIEAMQFGIPIVASNWRAIPAIVQDGVNGLIVPIKSPDRLREALITLISDSTIRKEMGEQSKHLFLTNYTIDKYYEKFQEMFDLIKHKD